MIEVSIVMPCLNEERTVGSCVEKASAFLKQYNIDGEIVIADNNSSDNSKVVAQACGARVVDVKDRGYGNALMGGIKAAKGTFIIMGDADDSYDFSNLSVFVEKLREGFDLVMGNRFLGGISPGAMPLLHRLLGNPVLSFIGRLFYRSRVGDFHCGLRGFNRQSMLDLELNSTGMEFASEMVVKATLAKYKITEVPTTLKADGRDRAPHLNSFRDGWRHLKLLALLCPRWAFFIPGAMGFVLGVVLMTILVLGSVTIGEVNFGIHTLLYASALTILGYQLVWYSICAEFMNSQFGHAEPSSFLVRFLKVVTLDRGLALGFGLVVIGLAQSGSAVWHWGEANFSTLEPLSVMKQTIPAVTLLIVGFQTTISSFFLGALQSYKPRSALLASSSKDEVG